VWSWLPTTAVWERQRCGRLAWVSSDGPTLVRSGDALIPVEVLLPCGSRPTPLVSSELFPRHPRPSVAGILDISQSQPRKEDGSSRPTSGQCPFVTATHRRGQLWAAIACRGCGLKARKGRRRSKRTVTITVVDRNNIYHVGMLRPDLCCEH
jgi:hypothetical protein